MGRRVGRGCYSLTAKKEGLLPLPRVCILQIVSFLGKEGDGEAPVTSPLGVSELLGCLVELGEVGIAVWPGVNSGFQTVGC